MLAAVFGRADCARLLIDAGADKDAKTNVRVGRCFVVARCTFVSLFLFCFLLLCFTGIVYFSFHVNNTMTRCISFLCSLFSWVLTTLAAFLNKALDITYKFTMLLYCVGLSFVRSLHEFSNMHRMDRLRWIMRVEVVAQPLSHC
jgi:hypothetical protein